MIKFVYFDVGGVVIKDFSKSNKWVELWRELGGEANKLDDFLSLWDKYEGEVCVGRDTDSILPILKEELGIRVPENYSLLTDGFVKRTEPNPSIWPIIAKVKSRVKIGLLTNAYPNMFEKTKKTIGLLPAIEWDVVVDSSLVGYKKPDKEIFEIAAEQCGEKPKNIFYIDNSEIHTEAAKKLGWQTYWYDSGDYEGSSRRLEVYLKGKL